MARTEHVSETPATRLLRERGVSFTEHTFPYLEHGGTGHSARMLGLPEYDIVKTLVMENEQEKPLIVLMHGTHRVSTKDLARSIGAKRVVPCEPAVAQRHSGYLVGGTSPFATRRVMPVFVERTILDRPRIFLNGGRRGYLLGIEPGVLATLLKVVAVDCATLA
jgi:Cys-tRNA(Pro) deacylase